MSLDRPAAVTLCSSITKPLTTSISGHLHQYHNQQNQIIKKEPEMVVSTNQPINVVTSNTVLVLNNHNIMTSPTTTISSHQQQQSHTNYNNMSSSKYLVLESQNHNNETNTTNYDSNYNNIINNGGVGGNIVVLATQQMDPSHNSTGADEELTPLTWLHDKNLLKGINLSCAKVQSIPGSPQHINQNINVNQNNHHNNLHLSPTSDFLEDSCVSEENSSVISNSDHGILLSPESSGSSTLYYKSNNNINNNLIVTKNRNALMTTSSTATSSPASFASSSPPSSLSSPTLSINLNSPHHHGVGQQAIVEYQLAHSMIDDGSSMNSSVVLNGNRDYGGGGGGGGGHNQMLSPNSAANNSGNSTPHQHFHKKYLREQLQQIGSSVNGSSGNANINNGIGGGKQYLTSPYHKYEILDAADYQPSAHKSSSTSSVEIAYSRNLQNEFSSYTQTTSNNSSTNHRNSCPSSAGGSTTTSPQKIVTPQKQKHPNNIDYDPFVHTHNKPPFSFSSLIFMAIEDSGEKALPVKEIYAWIVLHFPYFKTAPTGWKNSVRHNLSLNKSFQKVEKAPNMGKGSLWRVDPTYRNNLMQTLTRSQFHPNATIEKTTMKSIPRQSSESPTPQLMRNGRPLDADLFPHLSKYMAEMSSTSSNMERPSPTSTPIDDELDGSYFVKSHGFTNGNGNHNNNNNAMFINGNLSPERLARDFGADNIDDVNAATAMLALKHGPKIFGDNYHPIITSSPSEDHTYSQGVGGGGVNANGAVSTPVVISAEHTGVAVSLNNNVLIRPPSNISDNHSNGTSSDAAYESSEEGHHNNNNNNNHHQNYVNNHTYSINCLNNNNTTITPTTNDDLEEQRRRHAEGVDALLNLAGVSFTSPILLKRPATSTILEIQQPAIINNNNNNNHHPFHSNGIYSINNSTVTLLPQHHQNTVGPTTTAAVYQHTPPKKFKKTLRNKLKKKVWMR